MSLPPVALGITPPPAVATPLQQYEQQQTVQTLINQQALQKQAQQSNEVALQQQQLQAKQQQQAYEDQQTLRSLAPKYVKTDDSGRNSGYDYAGLIQEAQQKGVSPALLNQVQQQYDSVVESHAKADAATMAREQARNKVNYEVVEDLRSIKDPTERLAAMPMAINKLKLQGVDTRPYEALRTAPTDADLDNFEVGLGMHSQILADAKTLAETNEKNAEASSKQWQKFPELGTMVNTQTGEVRNVSGGVMPPGILEGKYVQLKQKENMGQPLSPSDVAFLKSYKEFVGLKPNVVAAIQQQNTGPALQGDALDNAAEKYWTTGQFPAGGRGPQVMAQNHAIMNRAAELHSGESITAGTAAYKANADSLKKLQGNFDQVTAFENTALKNLDQVAAAGAKVPDLSVRFANVPVRMISSQMIGTPEMAAFKTALLTAQTEAAKVLSSSHASGVLSDSARHEAQEVLDGNLPFPAMMASINQLKTDFGNRHDSYANQIADIQKRLGGKDGSEKPAGATHTGIGSVDKKKHWLDANGNDLGLAQ